MKPQNHMLLEHKHSLSAADLMAVEDMAEELVAPNEKYMKKIHPSIATEHYTNGTSHTNGYSNGVSAIHWESLNYI